MVLNAFCVNKKLFNEFQSGLEYAMFCGVLGGIVIFLSGLGWFGDSLGCFNGPNKKYQVLSFSCGLS